MHIRLTVCAVQSYSDPSYPRHDIVLDDPSLLTAHRPNRWKKVALSAAFALLTGAGCGSDDSELKNTKNLENPEYSLNKELIEIDLATTPSGLVAPIFKHGEGYGAFGCVVVSPPNYLSEAEAKEIIISVLKEYGISFKDDNKTKLSLTITGREPIKEQMNKVCEGGYRSGSLCTPSEDMTNGNMIDFCFDGIDSDKGIAFTYISLDDHYHFSPPLNDFSTLIRYYLLEDAVRLNYLLDGKTDNHVGIF